MDASSELVGRWREYWRDEADAAYLYRTLREVERDPPRKEIYRRLADVEDRHAGIWRKLLTDRGADPVQPRRSLRALMLVLLARIFGPRVLSGLLLRQEGHEVKSYLSLYRSSWHGETRDAALRLARESAEHARALAALAGRGAEPWHQAATGGLLRDLVYGFNDGLTANFGLVAGVIGANVPAHVVLISGVAGMIADAFSMGASGYLAAKSEREVYDHEIAMERDEIELMPSLETEELALAYESRGMPAAAAQRMAREIMVDAERGLEEKVRLELDIGPQRSTPLRQAWVTAVATAVGALIPVAPFLLLQGRGALWAAFALAMGCHFAVGAARSLVTGRGLLRSGIDMFAVGLGVAAVGYLAGGWLGKL